MLILGRIKKYFEKFQVLLTDLKMISLLDIAESGVDSENIPYIHLHSGEIFYSCFPRNTERILYKKYRSSLPTSLVEDSFRVALDIAQRFCRENCAGWSPPKTYYLFPGWGFIDLGAYIGFGAIRAARKIGQAGRVIAVEASPQAYRLLLKNIEANKLDNVIPVHAVAQDHNGSVNFFMDARQNNSIYQSLNDQVSGPTRQYKKSEIVEGKTVDTILAEVNYPTKTMSTFVSFEINGAEPLALLGMDNFLRTCPRFDLRIAARYGAANGSNSRAKILEILSAYPNVTVVDLEPLIFAHKYNQF